MKKIILPIFASLIFVTSAVLSADTGQWSYSGNKTGPENWASLSPDYALCGSGKNQSPVNIDLKKTVNTQNRGIKFNYGLIVPELIKNTGKNIQVDVSGGANIKVDGIVFELKNLTFHMPSEHTVNNTHFPMEIQFTHESKGKALAVVSMMVVPGKADRTLSKLLKHLPMNAGESKPLPANALRSVEMKKKLGNYHQYGGSTTTPPCTEGVRWFIMKDPLSISNNQQQAFKNAIKQNNNRPIQDLNARMIIE